jgi:hypothetical protein
MTDAMDDMSVSTEAKKKPKSAAPIAGTHKLKLLGVVPIPGTHKTYREDRRQARIEKRQETHSRRPSWEAGLSAGKY